MRILCVDDVFVIRKMVKVTVDALKGELLEAANGKDALDLVEKNEGKIDLILLDWNMPEMNGMEFLRAVKSNEKFRHIPVIMNTTESEKSKIIAAVQAGASNYIIKPFTEQELSKKIMDTVLSFPKLFNSCLCKELKNALNSITGLQVTEAQVESSQNVIRENYYSGQMLITGEINTLVSIYLSKENAARLSPLLLEKSQQELTPGDITKGLLKLLRTISDKATATAKEKMKITVAYLFAGFIGENMTVFSSDKKLYNIDRKFSAGPLESYLMVQYF